MSTPHPQESVEAKKEQPGTIPDPESPTSRVESMVEIVSPPDISGEQIALTVAAEVPSYAPEKCIASQGVYTTEKPITSMDGPTTSTSGVVEFEIEGTEEVMATEQDVFGSPDEEDTPAIVHDNDTCEELPNVQKLATIEAEFIKATTSVKSEEKKCKPQCFMFILFHLSSTSAQWSFLHPSYVNQESSFNDMNDLLLKILQLAFEMNLGYECFHELNIL